MTEQEELEELRETSARIAHLQAQVEVKRAADRSARETLAAARRSWVLGCLLALGALGLLFLALVTSVFEERTRYVVAGFASAALIQALSMIAAARSPRG